MVIKSKISKNNNNKKKRNILFLFIYKLMVLKIIFNQKANKILKNPNDLKVCLCTLGKMENRYAREFVEHYKKYDIDKIFIYDNNEIAGETFDLVLPDYINNKYVEIINYRGKVKIQIPILNDCYKNNKRKRYFELNEVKLNKIKYFESKINSNLTYFRDILNNNKNN